MKLFPFGFLFVLPIILNAQIHSGPMLGNNTMKEVTIWLQTDEASRVRMIYYPRENPKDRRHTPWIQTSLEKGFTANLVARNLQEGTTYEYQIQCDDKVLENDEYNFTTQALWQYRKDPPAFRFALGSCAYTNQQSDDRPGKPYGDTSHAIYESIVKKKPDFMLWLGDNIYLREPDFDSHSGIYQRYTHFKSQPYLQDLWRQMHHYATWDDHDFGPNNSDRSYPFKNLTRQAFIDFWANPSYGVDDQGIHTAFRWADCYFILLDNRYFKTPNDLQEEGRTMLGKDQLKWLKDRLLSVRANFIFVAIGGQFLNPSAMFENYATYENERDEILEFIKKYQIQNVIFLTGDRHRTELAKLDVGGMPVVYDFTCSPLTSTAYDERHPENNSYRIKGTKIADRNFGLIEVEGSFWKRKLTMKAFDKYGKEVWSHTVHSNRNK